MGKNLRIIIGNNMVERKITYTQRETLQNCFLLKGNENFIGERCINNTLSTSNTSDGISVMHLIFTTKQTKYIIIGAGRTMVIRIPIILIVMKTEDKYKVSNKVKYIDN